MSDRDEITAVLIRYATGIDTQDWPLFRTCFTDDVQADYGDIGLWTDVDGITEFMATSHQGMPATNHMLTNMAIAVDGDRAKAVTYVHAVLVLSRDPEQSIDAVGKYEDSLVRTADGWRIAARKFVPTRMRFDH
jgi:3-phenylpropionate/cinnamic acid dioxygenase small subunit